MNINTLRTGDLIVRQKGIWSTHYIVYIGWQNGVHMVADNHITSGVRFTTLENALGGNPIMRFEKFGGTEGQRHLVVPKIREMLGKSYDLVVFNCEHFARWIASGKLTSNQVTTASNILLISGAMMAASRNKTVFGLGLACLALGGIGHLIQK